MTLSKNFYGSMIAGAIAAMLMFQVFVNVGMNIGIMPVTGIPLPLMSSEDPPSSSPSWRSASCKASTCKRASTSSRALPKVNGG